MKFKKSIYLLITISLTAASYQVFAQTEEQDRDRVQQLDRERQVDRTMNQDNNRFNDNMGGTIYGGRLMTEEERNRYREKLKTASSEQQRNEIRRQHQKEMQLREKMNNDRGQMNSNREQMDSNRKQQKGR